MDEHAQKEAVKKLSELAKTRFADPRMTVLHLKAQHDGKHHVYLVQDPLDPDQRPRDLEKPWQGIEATETEFEKAVASVRNQILEGS